MEPNNTTADTSQGPFQVGDLVECVDASDTIGWDLNLGGVYRVTEIIGRMSDMVSLSTVPGSYVVERFVLRHRPVNGPSAMRGTVWVDAPQPTAAVPNVTVGASILAEASKCISGPRSATHGAPERSFEVIADLWTAYLDGRMGGNPVKPVTSFDVAQMMVLLKIARSIQGEAVRDHFVDAAGYSAIAGEIAESRG